MSTEAEKLLGILSKKIDLLEIKFINEAKEKNDLIRKVERLTEMVQLMYEQNYKIVKENKEIKLRSEAQKDTQRVKQNEA